MYCRKTEDNVARAISIVADMDKGRSFGRNDRKDRLVLIIRTDDAREKIADAKHNLDELA